MESGLCSILRKASGGQGAEAIEDGGSTVCDSQTNDWYLGADISFPSAAKKQARRRWDPPQQVRRAPAPAPDTTDEDEDFDLEDEPPEPSAEEQLRITRRAKMEEYAECVSSSFVCPLFRIRSYIHNEFVVYGHKGIGRCKNQPVDRGRWVANS
jgi:hypothetical protein